MDQNSSQIKVTIPTATKQLLSQKAASVGVNLTTYVKHLLLSDVIDSAYPTYLASDETDRLVAEAKSEKKLGSFNSIEELDKLVDSFNEN